MKPTFTPTPEQAEAIREAIDDGSLRRRIEELEATQRDLLLFIRAADKVENMAVSMIYHMRVPENLAHAVAEARTARERVAALIHKEQQ